MFTSETGRISLSDRLICFSIQSQCSVGWAQILQAPEDCRRAFHLQVTGSGSIWRQRQKIFFNVWCSLVYVKWVLLLLCLHCKLTPLTVLVVRPRTGPAQWAVNPPEFPFHKGKSVLELAVMQLFSNKTKDFLTLGLISSMFVTRIKIVPSECWRQHL